MLTDRGYRDEADQLMIVADRSLCDCHVPMVGCDWCRPQPTEDAEEEMTSAEPIAPNARADREAISPNPEESTRMLNANEFDARVERSTFHALRDGADLGTPEYFCTDNAAPCEKCGTTCATYVVAAGESWGAYPSLRLTIHAKCAGCHDVTAFRIHCPKPLDLTAAVISACDRNLHGTQFVRNSTQSA